MNRPRFMPCCRSFIASKSAAFFWPIVHVWTVKERMMMRHIFIWVLTVLAGGMFLFAGSNKVLGEPMMVAMFGQIGLGQWFRFVTGTIEVVVLVPTVAIYGATALAIVMIGAIATHFFVIGGSPVAAIGLLAMSIAIVYLRREQISSRVAVA